MVSYNIKKTAAALFRDESGQSTTEYVLLLLVVAIAVKSVGKQLKDQLNNIMQTAFRQTATEIQSGDN
jgi:Flp pilus assembly pilin Flp